MSCSLAFYFSPLFFIKLLFLSGSPNARLTAVSQAVIWRCKLHFVIFCSKIETQKWNQNPKEILGGRTFKSTAAFRFLALTQWGVWCLCCPSLRSAPGCNSTVSLTGPGLTGDKSVGRARWVDTPELRNRVLRSLLEWRNESMQETAQTSVPPAPAAEPHVIPCAWTDNLDLWTPDLALVSRPLRKDLFWGKIWLWEHGFGRPQQRGSAHRSFRRFS